MKLKMFRRFRFPTQIDYLFGIFVLLLFILFVLHPRETSISADGENTNAYEMENSQGSPGIFQTKGFVEAEENELIENELKTVHLTSIYKNRSISDFQPEFGGQPIVNLIVTTHRSGSSFLGEILNQQPGNFYHFEPLAILQEPGVNCPLKKETNVVKILKEMLKCQFPCFHSSSGSNDAHWTRIRLLTTGFFLCVHVRSLLKIFGQSKRTKICQDAEYFGKVCRKFPIHSMKLVNVELKRLAEILEDQSPNIRIVYLVRDPRGTMRSRQITAKEVRSSGNENLTRGDMTLDTLCKRLKEDHKVAMKLKQKYPQKFMIVHYEDLASDPRKITKTIYEFLHLDFERNEKLGEFLNEHTRQKKGGPFSVFRESKSIPFQWIKDAGNDDDSFAERVTKIQDKCEEAMKFWGYKLVKNRKELEQMKMH